MTLTLPHTLCWLCYHNFFSLQSVSAENLLSPCNQASEILQARGTDDFAWYQAAAAAHAYVESEISQHMDPPTLLHAIAVIYRASAHQAMRLFVHVS